MKISNKIIEIIVFLIFASILWSICFWFYSYGNMNKRNSQRISDINFIKKEIERMIFGIKIESVLYLSIENIDNKVDTKILSIWWRKAISPVEYWAWYFNETSCPPYVCEFKDPLTKKPYIMWITTRNNKKFELSTSMEQFNWNPYAYVNWNYKARTSNEIPCTKSNAIYSVVSVDKKILDLYLVPWDMVIVKTDKWEIKSKIVFISYDKNEVTLSDELINPYSINKNIMWWSHDIPCKSKGVINNTINIDSNYKDAFYPWDYVVVKTNSWEINEVINLVSSDWTTITLSGELNNPISIRLAESESIWLIDRKDADWRSGNNFVTNSGTNLPY